MDGWVGVCWREMQLGATGWRGWSGNGMTRGAVCRDGPARREARRLPAHCFVHAQITSATTSSSSCGWSPAPRSSGAESFLRPSSWCVQVVGSPQPGIGIGIGIGIGRGCPAEAGLSRMPVPQRRAPTSYSDVLWLVAGVQPPLDIFLPSCHNTSPLPPGRA